MPPPDHPFRPSGLQIMPRQVSTRCAPRCSRSCPRHSPPPPPAPPAHCSYSAALAPASTAWPSLQRHRQQAGCVYIKRLVGQTGVAPMAATRNQSDTFIHPCQSDSQAPQESIQRSATQTHGMSSATKSPARRPSKEQLAPACTNTRQQQNMTGPTVRGQPDELP
jgi:hypothetical protein